VLAGRQQAAQHVHRGQQRADRVAVEHPAPGAGLVEQGLEQVGQVGDRGKAERGRATLDRMGGAEDHVDRFRIGARAPGFEREQAALHRVQALAALLEECGVEAGDIHGQARTLRTVATSCSGSKGLTSQPVAPAALPSIFLSVPDSVVSISSGVKRYAGSWRSSRIRAMPSMRGMLTSVTTASNDWPRAISSAAWPSSASLTW